MALTTSEEIVLMGEIRAKMARGEKLTDWEQRVWAYSPFGGGNSLASGGCAAHVPVREVTGLVEPLGEN